MVGENKVVKTGSMTICRSYRGSDGAGPGTSVGIPAWTFLCHGLWNILLTLFLGDDFYHTQCPDFFHGIGRKMTGHCQHVLRLIRLPGWQSRVKGQWAQRCPLLEDNGLA